MARPLGDGRLAPRVLQSIGRVEHDCANGLRTARAFASYAVGLCSRDVYHLLRPGAYRGLHAWVVTGTWRSVLADDGSGVSTNTTSLSAVTGLGHRIALDRAVLSLLNPGIGCTVPLRAGWRVERPRLLGEN